MKQAQHPFWRFLVGLAALTLLMGCRPQPQVSSDFVVADLFATPGKSLATAALTPTPAQAGAPPGGTAQPTLPLPTVVVLQQPTQPITAATPPPAFDPSDVDFFGNAPAPEESQFSSQPGSTTCSTEPPLPFTPVWQNISQAQALLGCPLGATELVEGVFQDFESGFMFWRARDRSIFVLSTLGLQQGQSTATWWRLDDGWTEDQPESDPSLTPPDGLRQPVRGFGKVWRENGFVREGVGWATATETVTSVQWLTFERGWMFTGPGGAPIYVISPTDNPPYSTGVHLGPLP